MNTYPSTNTPPGNLSILVLQPKIKATRIGDQIISWEVIYYLPSVFVRACDPNGGGGGSTTCKKSPLYLRLILPANLTVLPPWVTMVAYD